MSCHMRNNGKVGYQCAGVRVPVINNGKVGYQCADARAPIINIERSGTSVLPLVYL